MTFKEKTYNYCLQLINEKVEVLQKKLSDLKESASNETKRTAGDKHETALAMLQIEQENNTRQLREALAQKQQLTKIDISINPVVVIPGSLVETDKAILFISTALGKLEIEEKKLIALSAESPLGSKLIGKKVNDIVHINDMKYTIKSIV